MRIVLDTSVVVAALRTRLGAGNAALQLVAEKRIKMLATPPLFLEYEDVLKRPEHRLAHGLSLEAIDEFLAELAALIEPVEVHFQWRPQGRDPNDEMVFEAAFNGRADALVTYNVADFAGLGERFKIVVMTPAELLKKVKS
ncbi:MAG TPA: putative toxin-antitoxin system toxin component, PIN family [Terriglobales bacterium]